MVSLLTDQEYVLDVLRDIVQLDPQPMSWPPPKSSVLVVHAPSRRYGWWETAHNALMVWTWRDMYWEYAFAYTQTVPKYDIHTLRWKGPFECHHNSMLGWWLCSRHGGTLLWKSGQPRRPQDFPDYVPLMGKQFGYYGNPDWDL